MFRSQRRIVSVSIFFLTFFAVGFVATRLRASTLWGNLKPGPYTVGYKTVFTYDLTRPSITRDAEGREIVPVSRGRQMQIGVWYPASEQRSLLVAISKKGAQWWAPLREI